MTGTPPPGWYPAPHANNESRYWDGQRWLEPAAGTTTVTGTLPGAIAPGGAVQATPSRISGLAVGALVLGIAAFVTGWVPWLGLLLAIVAVTFSVLALVKRQHKGFAITGLVLGGIALLAGLIVTMSFSAFVGSPRSDPSSATIPLATATPLPGDAETETEENDSDVAASEAPTASADGTVAHPYPQPYVATGVFGGEKYSLTGRVVDPNANALLEDWNQFNSDAPAGFKYVVVELTMTGIDPDGVEPSLAEFDLFLATEEGNRYSSEYAIFGDGMPSMSDGPTLYPGNSFTGYTAYIVPETAQAFLLYDNRNYISF